MTDEFIITAKARADLLAIGRYSQRKWGIAQRNKYLQELDNAFHRLAAKPSLGIDCPYIRPGYRKFLQGSHVIFYREPANFGAEIIRVLHRRMDFESQPW